MEPRVIKRYTNRKLYDSTSNSYVTLDEVAEMIRADEAVTIISNQNRNDITSATLVQIIAEKQKRSTESIPLPMLVEVIKRGGDNSFMSLTELANAHEIAALIGKLEERTKTLSAKLETLEKSAVIPNVANTVSLDA